MLKKKPTWLNTFKVFDHVGLLANGAPGPVGLPFIQASDDIQSGLIGAEYQ